MSTKRAAEEANTSTSDPQRKKQRRGYHVGPDNLPDGQWKRHNQQVKRALIDKAKLKKSYAKVKAQAEAAEADSARPTTQPVQDEPSEATAVSSAPHPDRQNLIDRQAESPEAPAPPRWEGQRSERRERRPKPAPFAREQRAAAKAKAEADERRAAREKVDRERREKTEERERFRKAMAKARTGGKNGQRKLGRESTVLLDRVRKMVAGG